MYQYTWGAWDKSIRNDPYPLFESTRAECPVRQIRLADGHDAWLVLSHKAAHQAPEEDRAPLREAFRTLFQPWSGSPPPEAVAASDVIVASLERLVATHRNHPQDDLVGVLVSASDDHDRLTEQELLSSLFQLIVAGHDTTTSLIGNGVVDLLENPDQWRILCRDPSRLPAAIEELIRFSTPVPHATFRVTTEPKAGVEIPARDRC